MSIKKAIKDVGKTCNDGECVTEAGSSEDLEESAQDDIDYQTPEYSDDKDSDDEESEDLLWI
ncbi:MAG: hypothetical protein ACOYMA_00410 [Bacteroidia bacterium]